MIREVLFKDAASSESTTSGLRRNDDVFEEEDM